VREKKKKGGGAWRYNANALCIKNLSREEKEKREEGTYVYHPTSFSVLVNREKGGEEEVWKECLTPKNLREQEKGGGRERREGSSRPTNQKLFY